MDSFKPYFTVRTCLSFLLLILLQTSTEAQLCSLPTSGAVEFNENNAVGDTVTLIDVQSGVRVELSSEGSNETFSLHKNSSTQYELRANKVLDAEAGDLLSVVITCTSATGIEEGLTIYISLTNVNDNPPVFAQSLYSVTVSEFSPNGTVVGLFAATDLDQQTLTYRLSPESVGFGLAGVENPELVVENQMLLNYDKVKNVELTLYAEDEPLVVGYPVFTATTTIMVTIEDTDNRPPWFQPCKEFNLTEGVVICQSSGYTGSIVSNEQEKGALPLEPGPLYAIDGDSGINDNILYRILTGNDAGLFEIDPNTGNITMTRVADVVEDINLVVMAAQESDMNQFAITTVTLRVNVKTAHLPTFEKESYEAVVTSVGNMAMNATNKNEALRIVALDDDYAAVEGINPHITYEVNGNSAFTIINGYLFMSEALPEGKLHLEVVATDESSGESATANLTVEVASGANWKSKMIALGVTLGVLLLICLVIIVVLVCHIQKRKEDWRKIYQTNVFRSSLGKSSGDQKEGIQYINGAFRNDADKENYSSNREVVSKMANGESRKAVEDVPTYETIVRSSESLQAILPDNTSLADSDKADSEKGIVPILTKERRNDEGYKSVWFKEDIDPDANKEVVIIPDSDREQDSDEEDREQPSSSREEDEDENLRAKTPRVAFDDSDMDSVLGVNIADPAESDSDHEKLINIDL